MESRFKKGNKVWVYFEKEKHLVRGRITDISPTFQFGRPISYEITFKDGTQPERWYYCIHTTRSIHSLFKTKTDYQIHKLIE